MKKLVTLLMLSISTFHVNAMLWEPKGFATSGVVMHYTQNKDTFVVLRKLSNKEFPNVISYGPSFEWYGDNQKNPVVENEYTKAILSRLALEKAVHYKIPDTGTFTLFTAEADGLGHVAQMPSHDANGEIVIKKLTDFCDNMDRFSQDPDTKEVVSMPAPFHETFRRIFFNVDYYNVKSDQ